MLPRRQWDSHSFETFWRSNSAVDLAVLVSSITSPKQDLQLKIEQSLSIWPSECELLQPYHGFHSSVQNLLPRFEVACTFALLINHCTEDAIAHHQRFWEIWAFHGHQLRNCRTRRYRIQPFWLSLMRCTERKNGFSNWSGNWCPPDLLDISRRCLLHE